MADATIGKAYIQIMPSAVGITDAIRSEMGSAGESGGVSFGNGLVGKIKAIIGAAAIGKALVATIQEGAALEQSLGGIETLFKGSADRVKKYASESFKTTGLSANEYMENVTSFSAAMISSLGGDTKKAADLSNQAMEDMSD